jgi:hypothetical protein
MKKPFILSLTMICIFSVAHSQQLILIPGDSSEISANVYDEYEPNDVHIWMINNTGSQKTVTWGMINYTAPLQWEVKLCDNNNCYDLLLNGGPYESLPIDAGDTMDMKFQYTAHLVTGSASTNIYAYVTNDSANSAVFLNYKANLTYDPSNGINDRFDKNSLKIFPNPVSGSFTVSGLEKAGNLSFEVFDLKGSLMKTRVLSSSDSNIEIATQDFPVGEYILKVSDSSGKTIGSARLNKVD